MVKKIVIIVLVILFSIGLIYFINHGSNKSNSQLMTGNKFLSFVKLQDDILAESGEFKVLKKEIDDNALSSHEVDRQELIYASAFKQFVLSQNRNDDVIFYTEKPSRSLKEIFIRYSAVPKSPISIKFGAPRDGIFIQVGHDQYSLNDVKRDDYFWGALRTKVFQRTIDVVKKQLVRKAIIHAAANEKVNTEEFIEKNILIGEKNKETPEQVQRVEEYVLNNLLELPIKINIEVPDFQYEVKPDWTPSFGSEESEVKVLVFTDFFSLPGRILLESMGDLSKKYPQVYFGFRPLFFEGDRHQRIVAEYGFCVWEYDRDKYWQFIPEAAQLGRKNLEEELHKLAGKHSIDIIPIKICFMDQAHKGVVDYHLNYGKYLGISYGPLVFIDGEILEGVVTQEMIEKVLKRKTWLRNPKNLKVEN